MADLLEDFQTGQAFRQMIIPRAVLYYTDEVDQEDDVSDSSDSDDSGDSDDSDEVCSANGMIVLIRFRTLELRRRHGQLKGGSEGRQHWCGISRAG